MSRRGGQDLGATRRLATRLGIARAAGPGSGEVDRGQEHDQAVQLRVSRDQVHDRVEVRVRQQQDQERQEQ
jgi:hypothetical protein